MEAGRIPNKLRSMRRCHGLSLKKVARLLGHADTSTLSRWERGYGIPGTVLVFRLSRIYDTHPHQLLDGLWKKSISECNLLAQHEPVTSN